MLILLFLPPWLERCTLVLLKELSHFIEHPANNNSELQASHRLVIYRQVLLSAVLMRSRERGSASLLSKGSTQKFQGKSRISLFCWVLWKAVFTAAFSFPT